MFANRKKHEFLTKEFRWLWVALSFQAGSANAGGFLACARFVSHMTGFGTQVGISLSELNYAMALEMLSAPLSFLVGAMASGFAVDRALVKGEPPRYLLVMFSLVVIFSIVTLGGYVGMFGEFGEPLLLDRDFALMKILCFACGMQNACFGSLTQGQIRTTHLTGILTDIGVTIVRLFYLDLADRKTRRLRRLNHIRIWTFVSFSCGSATSAILFSQLGWLAFGFLVLLSAALWLKTAQKARRFERMRARAAVSVSVFATETVEHRPVKPEPTEAPAMEKKSAPRRRPKRRASR